MRRLLWIVPPLLVLVVLITAVLFLQSDDAPDTFCANITDGREQCFPSVSEYFYAITDGKLLIIPEGINMSLAVQTHSAWVHRNATPSIILPTGSPAGSTAMTPFPYNLSWDNISSATPGPMTPHIGEFCGNLPDGEERCFPSVADYIFVVSGGRMTVVPDNIELARGLATYSAWVIENNTTTPSVSARPTTP